MTEVDPADLAVLQAITDVTEAEQVSATPRARRFRVVDGEGTAFTVSLVHPRTAARVATLAAALGGCPGADPVLLHGERDGVGWVVTGRYPSTLADLLASGPLEPERCAELLAPVAQALDLLHRSGYVHTAVHPAAVRVDAAGRGVLGDLDAAVPTGTVLGPAAPGRSLPGWTAPEAASGAPVGPATDAWAFALVAAEALTGGDRPDAWARVLPAPVAEAVEVCLADDPARRRGTPTSLVTVLRGAALRPWVVATEGTAPARLDPPEGAEAGVPQGRSVAAPGGSALERAAQSVFGVVDPHAPAQDRLPLRVAGSAPAGPVGPVAAEAPLWRRPVVLVATLLSVAAVVVGVVLTVV